MKEMLQSYGYTVSCYYILTMKPRYVHQRDWRFLLFGMQPLQPMSFRSHQYLE
uniref:Uncharacterized protein n=1 Tax=Arundo donax TaxID=35708 RepID=A0A0A8YG99_ARUDO